MNPDYIPPDRSSKVWACKRTQEQYDEEFWQLVAAQDIHDLERWQLLSSFFVN